MVWFRRSTWFQYAHRNEQAAGASTPELLLVSFGPSLRASKEPEETCENNCRMAQTCVLSKQVGLRSAALGCVLAQDWHTGNLQHLGEQLILATWKLFNSATFLSGPRYWEGVTAYRGRRSQRRGEFKAGQISFAHDGRLVPTHRYFRVFAQLTDFAAHHQVVLFCTCISPQAKIHKLLFSARLRLFLPNDLSFVLPRSASLVTYHSCLPGVVWSELHTHDQASAL